MLLSINHKSFWLAFLLLAYSPLAKANDCERHLSAIERLIDGESDVDLNEQLRSLESLNFSKNITCEATYHYLLGRILLLQGKPKLAQENLAKSVDFYQEVQEKKGLALSAYFLGQAFLETDQPDLAAPYFDLSLREKAILGQKELLAEAFDLRAMLHSNTGQHLEAIDLLKQAVIHLDGTKKDQVSIRLLNQISTNYQSIGQIDSAVTYYQRLFALKQKMEDGPGLLSDYITLGGLYSELGNYKEAQKAFIQAKSLSESLKDTFGLIGIYIEMAEVYLQERLPDLALESADKAISLASHKRMLFSEGQALIIKASVFERLAQSDIALQYYNNAYEIFDQLGLNRQKAEVLVDICHLEPSIENLEKTENSLKSVIPNCLETGDIICEMNMKLLLCDMHLQQKKDYPQVDKLLKESEKIALQTNNATGRQEVYRLRSHFFEQTGSPELALDSYRAFSELKDSIVNVENARTVQELEQLYETEKLGREITEQRAELRRRNIQLILLLVGTGILITLIVLVLYLNRRNKLLNEQKMAILEKERETQVLRAMVTGEEQERLRIARDLHDSLGAVIATAKMRVSSLSQQMPKLKGLDGFQKAQELMDDAYHSIREVSHNMMPGTLSKYGLEAAIANMCEAIEKVHRMDIEFIPYGLDRIDDDLVETNIFRIVQELLRNVVKHSNASEVIVQLTFEDGALDVIVEDNGNGFDPKQQSLGIGIESIRSRVLFLKGMLEIDSSIGKGSTFTIHIPNDTFEKQEA